MQAEVGPITYAACYASCSAAVAAGTLTPAGLVICFESHLSLSALFARNNYWRDL